MSGRTSPMLLVQGRRTIGRERVAPPSIAYAGTFFDELIDEAVTDSSLVSGQGRSSAYASAYA